MQNHILRICENFPYFVYSDICMHSIKQEIEDTDENAQWEKAKLMQQMRLYVFSDQSTLRTHLKR